MQKKGTFGAQVNKKKKGTFTAAKIPVCGGQPQEVGWRFLPRVLTYLKGS